MILHLHYGWNMAMDMNTGDMHIVYGWNDEDEN